MLAMMTIDSPLGELRVVATGDALCGVYLPAQLITGEHAMARAMDTALLSLARAQLGEYFAGQRTAFELPLAARGSAFQQRVWQALATIPFGTTWTYAELARVVARSGSAGPRSTPGGSAEVNARSASARSRGTAERSAEVRAQPVASRAVGGANARNPLSIIVPCHRVISASGALTGYTGGIDAKRWLLAHERRVVRGVGTLAVDC